MFLLGEELCFQHYRKIPQNFYFLVIIQIQLKYVVFIWLVYEWYVFWNISQWALEVDPEK